MQLFHMSDRPLTKTKFQQVPYYRIGTANVQPPGKWVFLVAVLMNVVGTLLSPILASVSHWWASITTASLFCQLAKLETLL